MGIKTYKNYDKNIKDINALMDNMAHIYKCDFLANAVGSREWYANPISSGTIAIVAGTQKHPGIVKMSSSASANSGYSFATDFNALLLGGGEKTTYIFKTATTLTGVTRRMGFHDTVSVAAPVDGVYCSLIDGVLAGRTTSNTALSTTSSTYPVASDTWYKLKIEINTTMTLATFTLYADDSNTVLWTDTLDGTNIPKTTGREVGNGDTCTYSGTSATIIGYLDYIDMMLPNSRII